MTFRLPSHTRQTIDRFRQTFPCDPKYINVVANRRKEAHIEFKIVYTGTAFPGYPVEIAMTTRNYITKDEEWDRVQAIRAYLDRPVDLTTGKPLPDERNTLAYQGPDPRDRKNTIDRLPKRELVKAANKFLSKTQVIKLGSTLFEVSHNRQHVKVAFVYHGRRLVAVSGSYEEALYLALDMIERIRICEAVRSATDVVAF